MRDPDTLRAYITVLSEGSLTAAASALSLSKSTLSRRLHQLEEWLGHALLKREANRLVPTEAGHVFRDYAERMLGLEEEGREALAELQGNVSGELILRSHEALIRGWFSKQIEAFMDRHPDVRVTLETQVAPPGPAVSNGVCLWLGEAPESSLRQMPLGRLRQGLYAAPDYLERKGEPRHPRELVDYEWVDLLGTSHAGLTLTHPAEGDYLLDPAPSSFRADQLVLQGDAIARGLGLGLMPHWLVGLRLSAHPGTLTPCLPEWEGPGVTVQLLYPQGPLPRRTRAFIEFLREQIPEAWQV